MESISTTVEKVNGRGNLIPYLGALQAARAEVASKNGACSEALELAERGIPVFPCRPNKRPLTDNGFQDATKDASQIRSWWEIWPDALVAVPTGEESGLMVLDLDPGSEAWSAENADILMAAGRVHYTRRGKQYPFLHTDGIRNSAGKIATGVDIRGEGGYVIWWPAHGYDSFGEIEEVAPVPEALLAQIKTSQERNDSQRGAPPVEDIIPEGQRDNALTSFAGTLRRKGLTVDEIAASLRILNESRCQPPVSANDIQRIATSVARYEAGAPLTSGNVTDEQPERHWPQPIDLRRLAHTSPTPPRMIIADWLPCGYATLFAAHGGSGKSSIALHLATCIASGNPWWGLPCASRKVLYLSCEDREDVLHWRLSHIANHEGLDLGELHGLLHLEDLVGHESILFGRDPKLGATVTGSYAELERLVNETRAEVVIVDGSSDTFGGNENDRAEVKAFVNHLIRLVGLGGAVIIVAHVNKPTASARTASEGYSGSTQWHNAVRARWYLHAETERGEDGPEETGNLTLALQKSNLGRDNQSLSFRYDEAAHMFLAEAGPNKADRVQRDEHEQWAIERALQAVIDSGDYCPAATTGNRTAFHVLSAREDFPDTLKGNSSPNRKRFWRHIERLRRMGVIEESSIRRSNRTHVATLTLRSAPHKACTDAPNE